MIILYATYESIDKIETKFNIKVLIIQHYQKCIFTGENNDLVLFYSESFEEIR
jgi:hypothetical protein